MAENTMLDAEEELLQKQKKERKELQSKIQSLKHGIPKGNKKKKKEITEEIAKLEFDLDCKHDLELAELRNCSSQLMTPKDNRENSFVNGEKEGPVDLPKPNRISKAQKRRDKKAEQERQREERIAEQEIANLNSERHLEFQKLNSILNERNLSIFEIPSDGNCLYMAVAHQLELKAIQISVLKLRKLTATYMRENPEQFFPFLTNPETDMPFTEEQFKNYCDDVENTTAWGGHVELQALSCVLEQPIEILQADGPSIVLGGHLQKQPLILSFHRHAFSLGEHYNSIIPKPEDEVEDFES